MAYARGTDAAVAGGGAASGGLLDDAFAAGGLRTLYQPIVDLATGGVVAHEALTRGPAGTALEGPEVLFAAARTAGRTVELDWACRAQAFRETARLPGPPPVLFVNTEPAAFDRACPPHLLPDWLLAHRRLLVVVELTERHLLTDPAGLLRVRASLRELGWELALDDVGATDAGVALLGLLEPDIIKLDRSMLAERHSAVQTAVMDAVRACARATGATIVAEGVERPAQLLRAVGLGAHWGQGFLFGRPGPVRLLTAPPGGAVRPVPPAPVGGRQRVPCDPHAVGLAAVAGRTVRSGEAADALMNVAAGAARAGVGAVLLVATGPAHGLPSALDGALDEAAGMCAFVAALHGPAWPARTRLARRVALHGNDPLSRQAVAVLLAPDRAEVVTAVPCGAGAWELKSDGDRGRATAVARELLSRVGPVPPPRAPHQSS